ncbi:MAG: DUF1624 domain-containing protein [Ignavibacteriae bacterium]|nr:DUF1624 domain-containing protein [Ignavibacteriota bacterium]
MRERFWEIDFSRGIAIILMVAFNYLFALQYFHIYQTGGGWLFWWLFPRIVASMFIMLAGVSIAISFSKRKDYRKHFFVRGVKIFCLGLVITAVTWLLFPEETIFFGILHMIGAGIIISIFFVRFRVLNLLIGAVLISAGFFVERLTTNNLWFLWVGIAPENFHTFDYFPLLPWLGMMLIGIFAGNTLYKKGKRTFEIRKTSLSKNMCFLGRHSLVIYMLHQVLLVLVLYAVGYIIL